MGSLVCKKSSGLCNIYGSLNCEDCGKKCKIGYVGDRCQSCSEGSTPVNGKNGVIDSEGVGVKCGKKYYYVYSHAQKLFHKFVSNFTK